MTSSCRRLCGQAGETPVAHMTWPDHSQFLDGQIEVACCVLTEDGRLLRARQARQLQDELDCTVDVIPGEVRAHHHPIDAHRADEGHELLARRCSPRTQ